MNEDKLNEVHKFMSSLGFFGHHLGGDIHRKMFYDTYINEITLFWDEPTIYGTIRKTRDIPIDDAGVWKDTVRELVQDTRPDWMKMHDVKLGGKQ